MLKKQKKKKKTIGKLRVDHRADNLVIIFERCDSKDAAKRIMQGHIFRTISQVSIPATRRNAVRTNNVPSTDMVLRAANAVRNASQS